MSQVEVATLMADRGWAFHQQTVSEIENGTRKVSLGEATDLAHCINSTVDALTRPEGLAMESAELLGAATVVRTAKKEFSRARRALDGAVERLERAVKRAEDGKYAGQLGPELTTAQRALEAKED